MKKGIKQSLFFIILNATLCTIASNRDTKHWHESAMQQADAKTAAQTLVPTAQGTSPSIRYSFDLIKPIQPILTVSVNNTDNEKIALFERVMETNPSPTYRLYHMAHDPIIIRYIRAHSEREFELHSLTDAEQKTILAHAIENNDAPFVSNHCMHLLNAKERKEAFLYAGDMNRPRVMLALIEKRKYESEEESAYRAIAELNDIDPDQIPTQAIHSMLNLIDQHKRDRTNYDQKLYKFYQKVVSLIQVKEKTSADTKEAGELPFKAISKEQFEQMRNLRQRYPSNKVIDGSKLHDVIAHMAMPRRMIMVPQLEKAIQTGDFEQVNALLAQGCSVNDPNHQGLNAVELAAHCGDDAMLSKLLKCSVYITDQNKQAMIKAAQAQKEQVQMNGKLTDEQKHECQIKYDKVIQLLIEGSIAHRLQKRVALEKSIDQNNIGNFVAALSAGANPNACNYEGKSYSFFLLSLDPLFLRLLFRYGGNPHICVIGQNQQFSLLLLAVDHERPKNFQVIADAGADPNSLDSNGRAIASAFMRSDNSEYLKIALNPRSDSAIKLDPNMLISGTDGVRHPLLYWAMKNDQPQNFQHLLDAGADIYVVDGQKKPIAFLALIVDIKYLKMLLQKGLDLQKLYSDGTNSLTLIAWADKLRKPEHKQLLENPQGTSAHGTNICAIQ